MITLSGTLFPDFRALPLLALLGVCLREAFSESVCVSEHQQGWSKHVLFFLYY